MSAEMETTVYWKDPSGTPAPGPAADLYVMHVITTLVTGGAERQLELLTAGSRHANSVVSLYAGGPSADAIRAAGHPVHVMHARGWRRAPAVLRLAYRLRRMRPDVVHVHLLSGQLIGIPAARLARVPLVVSTEHSLMDHSIEGRPLTRSLRLVHRLLERLATHVIAVSATTARRLEASGVAPERISVADLGVDLDAVAHDPFAGRAMRAEWRVGAGTRVIGVVARLVPDKRIDVALRACAPLLREGWVLVVAGGGPLGAGLRELAVELGVADAVHWVGPCSRMGPVLSGFDVMLSTSADETFGMAVVEALGNGLPVVYVACPALDGLGEPVAQAVRVAPGPGSEPDGETAHLTAAIRAVSAQLPVLPGGEQRGSVPAVVARRYGAHAAAARVDAVYDELLARRAARRFHA